jgi:hypothetical protein
VTVSSQESEEAMRGWSRAGSTLLGAGVAGFLLWLAAQWSRGSTGGYWAAYGVVAGAGLVFGMSQLRGRDGHPAATIGLAFVPVLIVAGWILLGGQPHPNWFRSHVLAWSRDIHVRGIVDDMTTWLGVLAFGIGAVLGVALEPRTRAAYQRRRDVATTAPATAETGPTVVTRPAEERRFDGAAASEPVAAERREVPDQTPVGHTTETETTRTT